VVDTRLTLATGTAERKAALQMVTNRPGNHRITLGADKAHDLAEFVADLRKHNVTPRLAQNTTIDDRPSTVGQPAVPAMRSVGGCASALRKCWLDQDCRRLRKTHHRGLARVGSIFRLTATAYNLVPLPKLVGVAA
jgi:hypothetical protein